MPTGNAILQVLLREAHNTAWPEVNLDALEVAQVASSVATAMAGEILLIVGLLQVTKVGRRVRQHVNPFKEELQVTAH